MSYSLQESTIGAVHEVQTLRQELAETRKKLQLYADTVVSLHGELRTLRESICNTCKRKFVLTNPSFVNQTPSSQVPAKPSKSTFSWRRLLKAHASDHISSSSGLPTSEIHTAHIPQPFPYTLSPSLPISMSTQTHVPSPPPVSDKPASISDPLTTTSGKTFVPKIVPRAPRWSAKRDAAADTDLPVTFVRTVIHEGEVQSVRFSANGKYLAAALKDPSHNFGGTIIIYDVETGKRTCVLEEYASQYLSEARPGTNCVCFSPNGRYLVVGDLAGRVTVWDIPNKRIRNVCRGHIYAVRSVDFSPNGRLVVSTSRDGTVWIWNMRDGSAKVFTDNTRRFVSVSFSPNGQYVAAGDFDGKLSILDVRTGRQVKKWTGHGRHAIWSVVFMPDGNGLLSCSSDKDVKYWDVSSLAVQSGGESMPTEILEYRGHTRSVYSIAISPGAQWVVSTSSDKTAILWNIRTAVRQYTLLGHSEAVSSSDFSPAGTYLATGCENGDVTLWKYSGT